MFNRVVSVARGAKKQVMAIGAAGTALVLSSQASATGWDYSTLTSGIDFGGIATGVLAVAAMLAAVYAGIRGARVVLSFLRS